MLRISRSDHDSNGVSRLLFSYPAGPKRANGTVLLSYDDHKTWAVKKRLIEGDFGYSKMDLMQDGTIVLIYENRSFNSSNFRSQINLVRFTLEWLTDGQDQLNRTKNQ